MLVRIEEVKFVDYRDFEIFATEKLNLTDYSFVATEECRNDSFHKFRVNGVLDEWDQLIENGVVNSNRVLFNTLCSQGFLDPGIYIVEVSW